jgi:hypothetical protein
MAGWLMRGAKTKSSRFMLSQRKSFSPKFAFDGGIAGSDRQGSSQPK